jgi:DNA (cytosine-5)-methyltransferase 1
LERNPQDLRHIRHEDFTGIDLLAAGVPCPPFSIASKQLGADDSRDMFPAALDLVAHIRPVQFFLKMSLASPLPNLRITEVL